ncbi:MAG: PilN domain-containing protein [Syntrophobacteraceae bacterium]
MIQINLLPVRARRRRDDVNQFILVYLFFLLLTVSVVGFLWIYQNSEIESSKKRVAQLKQEVAKYAQYEAMLKDLKQKKDIVDKKRNVIQDLQKDRDRIVRIMALLTVQVPPEKMWLDKFSQTANAVTLEGVAMSNEAIVEFMRNLESSPYIEKGSVNLTHSRQRVTGDMKLREFQINYRFFPFSEVQEKLKAKTL